jgi:Uma2 family endonuclease
VSSTLEAAWSIPPPRRGESYTLADLDAWPESALIEVHDGALIVNPPPTGAHQLRADAIRAWLAERLPDHRVLTAVGIRFDDASGYIPDVVVFRAGRPADLEQPWFSAADVALVVEVVSPGTKARDLGDKRDTYARSGIPHYWVADNVTLTEYGVAGVLEPGLLERLTGDLPELLR